MDNPPRLWPYPYLRSACVSFKVHVNGNINKISVWFQTDNLLLAYEHAHVLNGHQNV